jgi:hypothetical protein
MSSLTTPLRVLRKAEVEFILVGGLAAVLHGAPIQTYDVDIVYSREPANVARLMSALQSLDAFYRFPLDRRLRPALSHLGGPGPINQ